MSLLHTHRQTDTYAHQNTMLPGGVVDEWSMDMGSNPGEASHYIATVGKLFTPTVSSGAEGRLNQLTPGIAGTSVATRGKWFTCISSGLLRLNWWINRVLAGYGRGKGGRRCFCQVAGNSKMCDPIWPAGFHSGCGASSTNCYTALPFTLLPGQVNSLL